MNCQWAAPISKRSVNKSSVEAMFESVDAHPGHPGKGVKLARDREADAVALPFEVERSLSSASGRWSTRSRRWRRRAPDAPAPRFRNRRSCGFLIFEGVIQHHAPVGAHLATRRQPGLVLPLLLLKLSGRQLGGPDVGSGCVGRMRHAGSIDVGATAADHLVFGSRPGSADSSYNSTFPSNT